MPVFQSKKTTIALWIALLSQTCLLAWGVTPSKLPLEELVRLGVGRAQGLKAKDLQRERTHNVLLNSYFNLLPSLSLSAGKSFVRSSFLVDDVKATESSQAQSLALAAEWTLWDGYRNIREVTLANLDWEAQKIQSDLDLQTYVLDLVEQYLSLQVLLTQRRALAESMATSRGFAEEARELARLGAKTHLDVTDTEIQIQNQEAEAQELDNTIRGAERTFTVLINSNDVIEVPEVDLLKDRPYYMKRFEDFYASVRSAMAAPDRVANLNRVSPELRVTNLKLDRALEEYQQSRMGYFPTLGFKLSHEQNLAGYITPDATDPQRQPFPTTTAAFTLSWSVWDWWNTPRNIRNARKSYEIDQLERELKLRTLTFDIETQLERYEILNKNVERAELVVKQAQSQMEYSSSMYQIGRITLLQAQTARDRLSAARISLINRIKSKYSLAARLLVQAGEDVFPENLSSPLRLSPEERVKVR